jgi:hypothetical protein
MTDCLATLVKHVAELCQAGLEVCHYIEEFHFWRIHPLGHRKTLAFECPRIGWSIPAMILWRVTSLSFLYVINGKFAML